jgi:hypothetical protein
VLFSKETVIFAEMDKSIQMVNVLTIVVQIYIIMVKFVYATMDTQELMEFVHPYVELINIITVFNVNV